MKESQGLNYTQVKKWQASSLSSLWQAAPVLGSVPALPRALPCGVLVTSCKRTYLVSAAPLGYLFPGSGSDPLVFRECPVLLLYQPMDTPDHPATSTTPDSRCFILGAEQYASVAQISKDQPFLKSPSGAFIFFFLMLA